ncbi:unnamed protein product [Rotaria sordida]|uniref:Uncharacterized protein n=1 Tax=Rotaria sordida TaxID=392033 RepID=A0A814KWV2_9BILA|nr:unnamed protein product [Rotaria sordida]
MATSKKTSDPIIQGLSKLIDDPLTDENEKIKYIHKRIYMNYEKKKWINVIEDVNLYQKMTKSKKLEILKIKSEFQQFCHKSRMALIEIADDSDIDDDERERFFFTLCAKNADDFINGIGGQHLFDRLFSLHGLDLTSSLQILIELNVRYSFMYLSYLFISSAQVLNLYDEYFCTWFDEDDLMISLIIYGSRKSDILLGQTMKEYNELYTRLIEHVYEGGPTPIRSALICIIDQEEVFSSSIIQR